MTNTIGFIINWCVYLLLILNFNLYESKICDKLNAVNVDLLCSYRQKNIPCDEDSLLLSGTTVRATCKKSHIHSYYSSSAARTTVRCKDDGKWDYSLTSCVPECGQPYRRPQPLIVGGHIVSIEDYPWHVAIYNKEKILICSGTIVAPQLVISAAHCFYNDTTIDNNLTPDIDNYEIVVSKFTRTYAKVDNKNQKVYKIVDIRMNPNKKFFGYITNFGSDIVLLILNEKINAGQAVIPACIDDRAIKDGEYLVENALGKVVGWGLDDKDEYTEKLMATDLPFISRSRCVNIVPNDFKPYITNDKFCAGSETGPGVRQGDSGGGLLFKKNDIYYLRGIVSLKQPSLTGIAAFTDIADHVDWITSVRKELEQQPFKTAFLGLEASYKKMKATGQEDVIKLYDLSERVEKEIINQENTTRALKIQAQSLFNTLRDTMETIAVEKLTKAFQDDTVTDIQKLCTEFIDKCYSCFHQVMEKVISSLWATVSIEDITARGRKGFWGIHELISMFQAMYNELEKKGNTNTVVGTRLLNLIEPVLKYKNYPKVRSDLKTSMETIVSKLPKPTTTAAPTTTTTRTTTTPKPTTTAAPVTSKTTIRTSTTTVANGEDSSNDEFQQQLQEAFGILKNSDSIKGSSLGNSDIFKNSQILDLGKSDIFKNGNITISGTKNVSLLKKICTINYTTDKNGKKTSSENCKTETSQSNK
ncbi:uncharacterized protein LOC135849263 [Planococcus citri]|uniref:uncharacterized protein LOC135849263 n=1 Tax=Planococcus citri TaxID=170843 RepID=UPI0031F867C9